MWASVWPKQGFEDGDIVGLLDELTIAQVAFIPDLAERCKVFAECRVAENLRKQAFPGRRRGRFDVVQRSRTIDQVVRRRQDHVCDRLGHAIMHMPSKINYPFRVGEHVLMG